MFLVSVLCTVSLSLATETPVAQSVPEPAPVALNPENRLCAARYPKCRGLLVLVPTYYAGYIGMTLTYMHARVHELRLHDPGAYYATRADWMDGADAYSRTRTAFHVTTGTTLALTSIGTALLIHDHKRAKKRQSASTATLPRR